MPRFSRYEVEDGGDHFTIHLIAACKLDKVDYAWDATVTGTADGKIAFAATGTTNADFASNRIGLCVLYGAPSLKGQTFEAFEQSGPAVKGDFPLLVGSPSKLVAQRYQSLRYTTGDGTQVSCTVSGATFDMEDQRNWGDSSYKAYAPLRYQYPNLKQGQKQQQTMTLAVTNATAAASPEPLRLKVSSTRLGKLPAFAPSTQFRNAVAFQDISTGARPLQRGEGRDLAVYADRSPAGQRHDYGEHPDRLRSGQISQRIRARGVAPRRRHCAFPNPTKAATRPALLLPQAGRWACSVSCLRQRRRNRVRSWSRAIRRR